MFNSITQDINMLISEYLMENKKYYEDDSIKFLFIIYEENNDK